MTLVKKADLHVHSYYSDGTFSPTELVQMAVASGFIGMSITDHDTIEGFSEAKPSAVEHGLQIITGIEISAKFGNEQIHVLGYSFDEKNTEIREMCEIHQRRRTQRNEQMLQKLSSIGYPISMQEVFDTAPHARAYGRPHIALRMVQKGYVPSLSVAFSQYLGSLKPCYVEGQKWTVEEAILGIHAAGGYAVLAHPHLIKDRSCVPSLLSLPFDGLEGYYDACSHFENSFWINEAHKRGLLVTGGSDFHGSNKPEGTFGRSWTPYETFEILYKRFQAIP